MGGSSTGGAGGSTQRSITISGTGFGTKAQAGPVLFDDFESGTTGNQLENQAATIGKWQTGAGSANPVYTDSVVRSGARACKTPFTATDYNSSLCLNLDFTVAYLDYWTYVAPLDALPHGFSRNWKPFRLYGASDGIQSGITSLSGNQNGIAYFLDTAGGVDVTKWIAGYPVGTWFHIQYWLRMNDLGVSNGAVRVRIDEQKAGASSIVLRKTNAPMDQLRIGHYWATDPVAEWPYSNSGASVYVDDVYFDTSWARVELGDAADYAATKHREIQIVTSWSDSAVSFVPRRGTLPPGPAWAFVIGEDDSVLATEAVTLQ